MADKYAYKIKLNFFIYVYWFNISIYHVYKYVFTENTAVVHRSETLFDIIVLLLHEHII